MIRILTTAEEARLLTHEAVAQLPDGAELYIQWGGGYGRPHRYSVVQHLPYGTQVTETDASVRHVMPLTLNWQDIGTERWQHRCFLPDERHQG